MRRRRENGLQCAISAGVTIVLLALVGGARAADPAGTVTHLSGTLAVKRVDGTTRILSRDSQVLEGDTLATAGDSYARVKLTDGGEVTLRPDSQLQIQAFQYEPVRAERDNVVFRLLKGGFRAITGAVVKRSREKYRVSTVTATIGVRGTHFGALHCANDCAGILTATGRPLENGLHVDVAEGTIAVTNNTGTQLFSAGQFGFVRDANTPPVPVPTADRPRLPPPPERFESGRTGVGKSGTDACTI